MNKPIIGISASILVHTGESFSGYRRSYANEDYVNSVIKNGGIPFIIPISQDEQVIRAQIENIDGLILTGGHDIAPINYNQEPDMKLTETLPERDFFDMKLLELSIEKNIPVLGICRGFQLMNVYFGGTMFQDLSLNNKVRIKHDQVNLPKVLTHSIDIKKDSKVYEILGHTEVMVNSFHHQILDKVAEVFEVTASSKDGVVEAIEHKDYKFMIGVQWHPEMLHEVYADMNDFFKELIDYSK